MSETPTPGIQGLPLFYQQPEALSTQQHADLRLTDKQDMAFARTSNAVPLTFGEFTECARHFPIVFVGQEQSFAAGIVGLRDKENLFIDATGQWANGVYIPAYIRRYPFVFVQQQGQDQFTLCVDRVSNRLSTEEGEPFFVDGKPSPMTQRALDFCTAFQRQHLATIKLVEQLEEHDLLLGNQGTFRTQDGRTLTLRDFKTVDEDKFKALSDDAVLALHHSGALAMIHAHFISMRTWNDLVARVK